MTTPAAILAQLRADMQGAKETFLTVKAGSRTLSQLNDFMRAESKRLKKTTQGQLHAIRQGYEGLLPKNHWEARKYPAYHAIGATLRAEYPPEG